MTTNFLTGAGSHALTIPMDYAPLRALPDGHGMKLNGIASRIGYGENCARSTQRNRNNSTSGTERTS